MPSPSPQRKRAARVPAAVARRRIIDAANRLLRERRYRDLTVEDVMDEAGLTRTVFYRHFDGIASIVLGLSEDLVARVVAEADTGDPTDREMMRRQLALTVDAFREYGPLFLAFDDAAHHDEKVEQALRTFTDRINDTAAELIERGVALGHTPPMPVRDVAEALHAMTRHYLLDLVARDLNFDRDRALNALMIVWTRTTWP
jgi:TetR/AcrR family transcriptional regulator, ethionamide resistance regulator